jgi:hypothetical protein
MLANRDLHERFQSMSVLRNSSSSLPFVAPPAVRNTSRASAEEKWLLKTGECDKLFLGSPSASQIIFAHDEEPSPAPLEVSL